MEKKLSAGILVCLFLYGCNGINSIKNPLAKMPPYKKYIRSLEQAELLETSMVQSWIQAGENALTDSIIVSLPFSESGYFNASEPNARSYRFVARKGQVLTVDGTLTARENAHMFLELFAWKENKWEPLAQGDSALNLTYEFEKDLLTLIRIQPELLVSAYYTLNASLTPVLLNPVAGASNKSIRSFYGDSRDGGKRKHEGIDIFARKGTPVVAPTDGYISRVGTGKLGGNVVWMKDKKRGHAYYFAHLDKQLVTAGEIVRKGDTLGTVGNTGNARYTPSHLHFGIYQSGSVDPVHHIRTLEEIIKEHPWDTSFQQPDFKVTKNTTLQVGPTTKPGGTLTLTKDTYLRVIAQSNEWYRVMLPNQKQGFVQKNKISPIVKGKKLRIQEATVLLSNIQPPTVPITEIMPDSTLEVLAIFDDFKYVRTPDGLFGWLKI